MINKSSTFFSRSIDSREKKYDANPRGKPRGFQKVLDKLKEELRKLANPKKAKVYQKLGQRYAIAE